MNEFYQNLDPALLWTIIIVWIINVTITYILSFYTLIKYLKSGRESKSRDEKENIITWIFYFIFIGIANTMNIFHSFFIEDQYIVDLIDGMSNYFIYASWLVKVFPIERLLKRHNTLNTHYLFTFCYVILIIFAFAVNPINIVKDEVYITIFLILSNVAKAIFIGVYLYLAIKTLGTVRRNALKVAAGVLILDLGMTLQPVSLTAIFPDLIAIIPYLSIVGTLTVVFAMLLLFDSYRKSM
jgi:hypothetical protein